MSLPIYQRVAVTDAGDVIPGAEYTVINENTGVAAPIYSDRAGATLLTAPYFADGAGTIQFFIAQGTTFRVAASGGVGTYTDRYVYGVAEAVLVQANGDVLVGKTSASVGVKGFAVVAGADGGYTAATRDGGAPGFFNRLTSDGTVLEIAKGSGIVGSWNSRAGLVSSIILDPRATAGGVGLGATDGNAIVPTDRTGALVDGTKSFGAINNRWEDIYLSNAPTVTSDGNTKQDILKITESEAAVAKVCKGLLRSFRLKSAVAEKGDDARIHFGIIAQDLQDAFTAEGLDAGRYGMFISSTWWEAQTEAFEGKDAYMRTDTFETLAEAPTGATERTRLGVRYSELLAFIIAAI